MVRCVGERVVTAVTDEIGVLGQGLEAVWLPALVLFGFAVLWFTLAVWRFKFE